MFTEGEYYMIVKYVHLNCNSSTQTTFLTLLILTSDANQFSGRIAKLKTAVMENQTSPVGTDLSRAAHHRNCVGENTLWLNFFFSFYKLVDLRVVDIKL